MKSTMSTLITMHTDSTHIHYIKTKNKKKKAEKR